MSGKVAAKPTYKLMGSRKNVKKSDSGIKRNIIQHILADNGAYFDPTNNIRDLSIISVYSNITFLLLLKTPVNGMVDSTHQELQHQSQCTMHNECSV